MPLEQVIAAHLDPLFPGMEIVEHHLVPVTRDADLELEEDEAEDLLAAIETSCSAGALARAVRLEVDAACRRRCSRCCCRELELEHDDVYVVDGPLDLGGLWALYELDRPDLKDEPWTPSRSRGCRPRSGEPADIFAVLRDGRRPRPPPVRLVRDLGRGVHRARRRTIRTCSRSSRRSTAPRRDSPIVQRADPRGRGAASRSWRWSSSRRASTSRRTSRWARTLEEAGVHVVYGVVGLKTHAKIAAGRARRRPTASAATATSAPATTTRRPRALYEDLGLLSADPELGADVAELFNFLTGYSRQREYRQAAGRAGHAARPGCSS